MNAQQLKNSILQMAVQGKLVPQDPNDEPASVLVERIRAEKDRLIEEGKIKKEKNLSRIFRGADNLPYEQVGKNDPVCIADKVPFEIPDSWEWIRFKNCIHLISGTSYKKGDVTKEGIRILRGGNIQDFKLVLEDSDVFLPYEYTDSEKNIRKGDIIFVASTGSKTVIGKPAPINDDYPKTQIGAFLRIARPLSEQVTEWSRVIFKSDYYRAHIRDSVQGTNINNIRAEYIEELLIPIPPFNEQSRIAEQLLRIEPFIETYSDLENKLDALDASFPEQLTKAILQWAVQGKLVPQDPNDEPASALLERIRLEKARLVKEGKIKKSKNESVIYRRDNSHYEKLGSEKRCIDDEIPFEIPDSWKWCRISSLLSINPRNQLSDDLTVGFMPMPLLEDGFKNNHTFEERKWKDIKSGFTHFKDDDVVIAKITPCFQNRKSAVISGLPNGYGAGTTELHVLRDETHILYMPYILLICKTHAFIVGGITAFTGTAGQQRVGKDYIANYLIPVPPVQEQIRIVDAVKSILSPLNELL